MQYKKMVWYGLGLLIVIMLAIYGITFSQKQQRMQESGTNESLPLSATVTTPAGNMILIREAITPGEQELGLSYFSSLPENQGMLFSFDKPAKYAFWMKGMQFPLDIIWLKSDQDKNGSYQVTLVAPSLSPNTYPESFSPHVDSDAVLEINAGEAQKQGISVGATLSVSHNN